MCELRFSSSDDPYDNYYIDGTDAAEEGVFVSATTGEELTYFNWYSSQPDGSLGQNCVLFKPRNGMWYDASCHDNCHPACQSKSKSNFKHF